MITDECLVIRKRAVALIQKARDTTMKISNTTNIREYLIPHIDINAGHYSELIDWDDDELILTEPPMFAELSNTEIEKIEFETLQIPNYPCNTQSVEIYVKLVTEASEAVYGKEDRNGWILNTIADREKNPCFETKFDFKLS